VPGLARVLAQCVSSPDGRWLAYASREGGDRPQVYVQSITGSPGRWQISAHDGYLPAWTRGGRELVFESEAGLMAVDIDTGQGFRAGTPRSLFRLPRAALAPNLRTWTCTGDGQRFFVLVPPDVKEAGDIEVVTDFGALVNRR
jgi:hypothetical protein